MKSLKLLLSAVAILAGGLFANSQAQCVASFAVDSFASAAGTVNFYSTSTSASNASHSWSFSGATSSSSTFGSFIDTISVTYPSLGWYTVCLTISDSAAGCTSTTCDSVYIAVASGSGSPSLNTGSNNTTCGTCTGTAFVSVSGGTAPYAYTWSNGATTPQISNLCAGTYNVTVTDGNGNTATSNANVLGVGGINVQINVSADCSGATLTTTPTGTAPFTYSWSNGQTTATAFYPSSGTSVASVMVTDANGCSGMDSTFIVFSSNLTSTASSTNETCLTCCDGTATVSVSGSTPNNPISYSWSNGATTQSVSGLCPGAYTVTATDTLNGCTTTSTVNIGAYSCPMISGNITQGDDAMVYLITESAGVLTAVDSVVSDSGGYYYFMNACPGTYYVKAALLPTHSMYTMFVPTYYVNSSLWGSATAVLVSGNTTGIDINLLTGTNTGGPGFIGGAVAQGANRAEGDPIADVQIILLDANDEVAAFTRTDANGEYGFDNLAYGNYKVFVEMINFDAYPFEVVVSADNEEVQDRDFVVEAGSIKPVTPLGVEGVEELSIEVYPNPASDVVTIAGTVDQIEVYNILGAKVMSESNNGTENMLLDVSSLTSGQYILSVKQGEQTKFVQLVIK
jgi:hypothetical protein